MPVSDRLMLSIRRPLLVRLALIGPLLIILFALPLALDTNSISVTSDEYYEVIPLSWIMRGNAQRIHDDGGDYPTFRVEAHGYTAAVTSNMFPVPSMATVRISAWLRAEDVVSSGPYHHLRLTLSGFASDRTTRLQWWDLLSTDGSFDWSHLDRWVIVPPDVAYMRLSAQITDSYGTFWLRNPEALVFEVAAESDPAQFSPYLVIPHPWQLNTNGQMADLGTIGVVNVSGERRLNDAVSRYLHQMGLPHSFVATEDDPAATLMVLGDRHYRVLDSHLAAVFPDVVWEDLGDQGYFLSIFVRDDRTVIYIGGNSDVGRFYGLQTLRQLVSREQRQVYQVNIVDRPQLGRRGIVMGIQWFRHTPPEVWNRLSSLKLNFVWLQGSVLNQKLWYRWRDPLTDSEAQALRAFVSRASSHFVEPYVAIGPRGPDASRPTIYSSEADIQALLRKMEALYALGVRNFGLTFDDIGNLGQGILFGADVDVFEGDIGRAHVYFVNEVYRRFRESYDDIRLMVVPMVYDNTAVLSRGDARYLQVMRQLAPEIQLITVPDSIDDLVAAAQLTGREQFIWDNYWTTAYQHNHAPEYVVPINRPSEWGESMATGYIFLPIIPILEDRAQISWYTSADYAWNPQQYDPRQSFDRAVTVSRLRSSGH